MNRTTKEERDSLVDAAVRMFKDRFGGKSSAGKEFVAAFQAKHPDISLERIRGYCAKPGRG